MYHHQMINRQQIRAARGLLEWNQGDVAEASGISLNAFNAIERGASTPRARNLTAIQEALEKAGVDFISENGGGPGVRLRK